MEQFWYEQSDGDGDFTTFIEWLQFFNTSSDSEFEEQIGDYLHIKSLLKQMVIESFMLASDNLASGQNYYAYNRVTDKSEPTLEWQIIEFDFDECFYFDQATGQPEVNPNVFSFFVLPPTDSEYDPLLARLLSIPDHNASYIEYYNTFLDAVFGSDSSQDPVTRYSSMLQFTLPWVSKDLLWQISFGMTPSQYILDAEWTMANLPRRYQDVHAQLLL